MGNEVSTIIDKPRCHPHTTLIHRQHKICRWRINVQKIARKQGNYHEKSKYLLTPPCSVLIENIIAKKGFLALFLALLGVFALFFAACEQLTNSGTKDAVITQLDLSGLVTAPVTGAAPDTTAIDAAQFSGTIAWKTANGEAVSGNFAANTVYKAEITLTAKTGHTFTGIAAGIFTYTGASVTHAAGSGNSLTITITFPQTAAFVAVTGISGVPGSAAVGSLVLTGTVAPVNATNKTIVWTVTTAGDTGAAIASGTNTLTTTATGTVTITAAIENGTAQGTPYTQTFTITILAAGTHIPVTNITGVPTTAVAGTPLALTGTVEPSNATNQTIVWSVTNAGTTGATIASGNTLNTSTAGIVTVTAAIENGATAATAYTQSFTITVNAPPVAVSDFALGGLVTAPASGAAPNTSAINAAQYSGTIAWKTASGAAHSGNFAASTVYKAELSLSAKTGFTFTGVAADSFTYTGATVTHAEGSGANLIVTISFPATAAVNSVTVTFQTNGGSSIASQTLPASGGYVNEPVPAFTLYFNFNNPVSGNTTIYTKWNPITYTVSFNSNGGSGSMSAITCTYDAPQNLPAAIFTRTGYGVSGWNTLANGSGMAYTNGQEIVNLKETQGESLVLYAQWKTAYTVTFSTGSGSTVPSQLVFTGEKALAPAEPTRAYNVFAGWYGDEAYLTLWNFDVNTISANTTIYAKWTPVKITSIEALAAYLAADTGSPIPVALEMELSETNWNAILSAINTANKFVSLDLSACTKSTASTGGGLRSNGDFDPLTSTTTGKAKIVNLTLPTLATGIVEGASSNPTFKNFTALKIVSGAGVTSIGDCAFSGCTALTSASFPAATSIGGYAFSNCTTLTSVSFPAATAIGRGAFLNCTTLTSVSFPAATAIGYHAFSGCTVLSSASFPAVTSIGGDAFSVSASSVSNFYSLTITLGATPPTVGTTIFAGAIQSKPRSVAARIPLTSQMAYGRSSYVNSNTTTQNWGNAFRGRGWDPTNSQWSSNNYYGNGNVYNFVNLTFLTY